MQVQDLVLAQVLDQVQVLKLVQVQDSVLDQDPMPDDSDLRLDLTVRNMNVLCCLVFIKSNKHLDCYSRHGKKSQGN